MKKVSKLSNTSSNTKENAGNKLPSAIWVLGFMMLLINASNTMIYSLSAVYLRNILGISSGFIGLLDGIAEGASYGAKLFSGIFSDYFKKRKIIVVFGYTMMVLSRPIIAFSPVFINVSIARFLERVGNGIQATPRDALVSDIAPNDKKGECFGLMRSIGIIGSFLGSSFGYILMIITCNNYQLIFWLATLPAILAVSLLVFKVKEPIKENFKNNQDDKVNLSNKIKNFWLAINIKDMKILGAKLGKKFWLLMIVVFVLMLARVSETFLVLHANQNFGLEEAKSPFVMIAYNLTYCLSAYPIGKLSDRVSRFSLLSIAIIGLVIADLILWQANSLNSVFLGIFLWGIQMGMSQSTLMALIADMAPEDLRGTAFGFFYLISAFSSVICGISSGFIAHNFSESIVFLSSGIISIIAFILIITLFPIIKVKAS